MNERELMTIRRARQIYEALSAPYIEMMCKYMANVPKAPFAVAVVKGGSLVPFEEAD